MAAREGKTISDLIRGLAGCHQSGRTYTKTPTETDCGVES